MWKQKIGISIGNSYALPTEQVVDIVAETGFDAVSPEWGSQKDWRHVAEHARSRGLAIQSLHAPYGKSAGMWSEDPEQSSSAVEELLTSLEDCADCQIPILVCHTWIGFHTTDVPNEIGLQNFRILVERAKTLGVKIAFENTEGDEFLEALMLEFAEEENVGFCWDSGHEMCYNHSEDLLARYGQSLIMTHLNDNLGISRFDGDVFWTDDLHLLPFDGIADWNRNVERLKRCPHLEYLNFELNIRSKPNRHETDLYAAMPLEVYFAEAYKRACRIAARYSAEP